jgi:hypothetical protein
MCLAGCQTWTTVEFAVPLGKEMAVRAGVREVSVEAGLLPCSQWKVRVQGADECYGGRVAGSNITAIAIFEGSRYVVKLGAYSAGIYDHSSFEALEARYRRALEALFSPSEIVRTQTRNPLPAEPVKDLGATARTVGNSMIASL